MGIKIIKPGIFTTIQDLGRIGYRAVGIGPGGAMDTFAATVANYLVENDKNCPVIEMHFPAAEMVFESTALVSITGGDFGASLNEAHISPWKPFFVQEHDRLTFKNQTSGARIYLAIHGGIKADEWLKSCSTHSKLKAGGYKGRALLKADRIELNKSMSRFSINNFPNLKSIIHPVYEKPNLIRCIAGPEWNLMQKSSQSIFSGSTFSITTHSDRMGFRLKGTNLAIQTAEQLISSPVNYGCIQLLPNGQLIVLMADHQTTGGYPRIASVISADLPKLSQSAIHSNIQFEMIAQGSAEDALFSLHQTLRSIKNNCNLFYAVHRHQL